MDEPETSPDWALVLELGGPSKVAELLDCSVQRVQNWKTRGVPAEVKLDRPDLFLPQFKKQKARA